jgi:uncharacterized protein YdeI (YjbR/CyaY-like superfamily)
MEVPLNSFYAESRKIWRDWLAKHHIQAEGIWLIYNKKSSGKPSIAYDEMVEEALCFGWVDSKPNKLDDVRTMLWFAPRKPRTGWSALNKTRIARLIEADLMMPAGLAKVEAAKQDGTWNALDEIEKLVVPVDLAVALAQYPHAAIHFAAFPKSAKRGILEWILVAKKLETRLARIEETARLANENIRANQWKQKANKL